MWNHLGSYVLHYRRLSKSGARLQYPLNIGTAIDLHGFQLHEAMPLLKGLEEVITQPEAVLQEIIYWTEGQPFLTQKLCQLIVYTALKTSNRKIGVADSMYENDFA
ncbi:hypothetical protein LC653_43160 [Nostoc sp. CHAB 5784]|uniref:hypothetical protein n=1 Tax=Nostoc mirabile TaxID=2907820 RepID=UPI001E287032|nr:hypothetical protein [Nostoc mirabile]MCC5670406.1 hypothetical protein [Nostoc mirabile CHAB5784]